MGSRGVYRVQRTCTGRGRGLPTSPPGRKYPKVSSTNACVHVAGDASANCGVESWSILARSSLQEPSTRAPSLCRWGPPVPDEEGKEAFFSRGLAKSGFATRQAQSPGNGRAEIRTPAFSISHVGLPFLLLDGAPDHLMRGKSPPYLPAFDGKADPIVEMIDFRPRHTEKCLRTDAITS